MRRLTSCIGIALLTLLVNGWGVVLAVALCPHGGFNQQSAPMAEEHGCHAKKDKPELRHSRHESSHGAKKVVTEHGQSNGAALSQRAGSCGHCVSRNQLPTTLAEARELNVKKVYVPVAQPGALIFELSFNFAPSFIPTQHAPPIASNRKHLLLGVFLI